MSVRLPSTPDRQGDLEARQALLSENGEATSHSVTPGPAATMPRTGEESRTKGDSIAGAVVLAAVALLTISTWITVFTHKPSALGWFAPHPLLQTVGLSCITYGICTLQPTSFADPQGKAAGLTRHQIAIFCIGFPALLLGTWSIWHNKSIHDKPHITTWHGTFGVASITWMFVQISLGIGSVWWGGALFGGGMRAKAVWKYHRLSGYLLFPLFFSTVHLGGAWSDWAAATIPLELRFLVYTVVPALVVVGVFWRLRRSKMKFFQM